MRYPIGNQDFRTLREDGSVYVDKTEHICGVANAGSYFFLSRPRRFGKSLTVSTLNELYSGDRALFGGLWAHEHWDFTARRRPVIWVRFANSGFQNVGLEAALHEIIDREAARHNVKASTRDLGTALRFRTLMEAVAQTHTSGRCVVLVDEYDKPIIEYLDDLPRARANRDMLRPFYGVLKDADPYIELVFVTGVSAFGKVSLFSDLNNIRQLTLDPLGYTLVGLTEGELDAYFLEQIAATGYSREEIRQWYNGYTWGGERVYNPWSILQFLASGRRDNYWSTSGTPKFVTDLLARDGAHDLEGQRASGPQLTSFDLDHLQPLAILWQGGYLTLDAPEPVGGRYTLRYPNREVRQTFTEILFLSYGYSRPDPAQRAYALEDALLARDLETFAEEVDAILAAVPYELWRDAAERFYHAVLLTAFRYIGTFEVQAEVSSARGRADVVLLTDRYVYAIEFKLLRPTPAQLSDEDARDKASAALAEEALTQIRERGYLDAYRSDSREAIGLGVVFDAERRKVAVVREG